ncbi:MAG: hypothetical protein KKA90_04470 [Nanoarchaeota archaeon]|nr:hypothetical protein [Nanoarchaeota archaeon]
MNQTKQKLIARERIAILLTQAEKELSKRPWLSRRHVIMARKLATRATVRIPSIWKICRTCSTLLIPGRTARVRANATKRMMTMTCKNCGAVRRFPY